MKRILILAILLAPSVAIAQNTGGVPAQGLAAGVAIQHVDNFANIDSNVKGLRDGERITMDGSYWIYDAADTTQEDALSTGPGTIINGPGGVGRLHRQYDGGVRPEWWGIDGTADEVEINKAFTVSSVVKLAPAATYTCAAPIEFTASEQKLLGNGATINSTSTTDIIRASDWQSGTFFNCYIDDLRLSSATAINAIRFQGLTYGTFRNIWVSLTLNDVNATGYLLKHGGGAEIAAQCFFNCLINCRADVTNGNGFWLTGDTGPPTSGSNNNQIIGGAAVNCNVGVRIDTQSNANYLANVNIENTTVNPWFGTSGLHVEDAIANNFNGVRIEKMTQNYNFLATTGGNNITGLTTTTGPPTADVDLGTNVWNNRGFTDGSLSKVLDKNNWFKTEVRHDSFLDWQELNFTQTATPTLRYEMMTQAAVGQEVIFGVYGEGGSANDPMIGFNEQFDSDQGTSYLNQRRFMNRNAAPTSAGLFSKGDVNFHGDATQADAIGAWYVVDDATLRWRALGRGSGTTAQRPALTVNDDGYDYYDTDLGRIISREGNAWHDPMVEHFDDATVASAATTNIGAESANFIQITGTASITSLGTAKKGTIKTIQFLGAATLVHGANLQCLGNGNITADVGDFCEVIELTGGGTWGVMWFTRRDTAPAP